MANCVTTDPELTRRVQHDAEIIPMTRIELYWRRMQIRSGLAPPVIGNESAAEKLIMTRDQRVGRFWHLMCSPASGRSAMLVRVRASNELGLIEANDLIELKDKRVTIGFEKNNVQFPPSCFSWPENMSFAVFTPGDDGTHVVGNVWMGDTVRVGIKPFYYCREHTLHEGDIVTLGRDSLQYRYTSIGQFAKCQ
jgi:hypothetical protein